jgi:uncharacterized protein
MKWNLNYIQKNAKPSFNFEENIIFDDNLIKKINGLYGLENLSVIGKLKYIESIEHCVIDFEIKGTMKLKCALSNEDINYYFSDTDSLTFSFENSDDEEIIFAKGNVVDITPYIWQLIVVNVPLKVVKEGYNIENKIGKNWKISTEEEKKEQTIDPRLESLKNYFDKQ